MLPEMETGDALGQVLARSQLPDERVAWVSVPVAAVTEVRSLWIEGPIPCWAESVTILRGR
jgi:hypothetical protein